MTDREIAAKCIDLQFDLYEARGMHCAPAKEEEYDECVSWIADQLRKSALVLVLTEEIADICDDDNAHMAAEAVRSIVNG